MKKSNLIIIVTIAIALGVGVFFLLQKKECKDLNEKQCQKNDSCLSVLVPCQGAACPAAAVFQKCKDKVK